MASNSKTGNVVVHQIFCKKSKCVFLNGNITFKPFFISLQSSKSIGLDFDNEDRPTESSINFDPFIEQTNHDDINITALKNRQLKTMFSFNANSQITNICHNNWKAFISSPKHTIPRNAWYRLLHRKIIHPIQLAQIIPANVEDEYCPLCKLSETEQHMFFTCIQKQGSRKAAFKRYLSNPKDFNCSAII
ncbi:hypothetical protein G6F43_004009 [Rhizopus delemar]|nr:hypothetical protein G6F43_004009 [Rhizopus delemar]